MGFLAPGGSTLVPLFEEVLGPGQLPCWRNGNRWSSEVAWHAWRGPGPLHPQQFRVPQLRTEGIEDLTIDVPPVDDHLNLTI